MVGASGPVPGEGIVGCTAFETGALACSPGPHPASANAANGTYLNIIIRNPYLPGSFRNNNRLSEGEFPMADDNGTEREHTTIVETGGGGGGGVLAIVLLIVVVLVLLYVFRADLGLGGKTVIPSTVNVNVNHS